MSIRHSMLALLAERPMYGYQLRQEFERRTGATWPLNVGQVYTTLARLQRDGLVSEAGRQDDGSLVYALTDAGRVVSHEWWATPVSREAPARDELFIKVALAVSTPGVDVAAILQTQRAESLRVMQDYTRLVRRLDEEPADRSDVRTSGQESPEGGEAWPLVLDGLRFTVEAEIRWLDHVEERLRRRGPARRRSILTDEAAETPQSSPEGDLPDTTVRSAT